MNKEMGNLKLASACQPTHTQMLIKFTNTFSRSKDKSVLITRVLLIVIINEKYTLKNLLYL